MAAAATAQAVRHHDPVTSIRLRPIRESDRTGTASTGLLGHMREYLPVPLPPLDGTTVSFDGSRVWLFAGERADAAVAAMKTGQPSLRYRAYQVIRQGGCG